MNQVKAFSDAGAAAAMRLLDEIDDTTVSKISEALEQGAALRISLLVGGSGRSEVCLELLGPNGAAVPIVTVTGNPPKIQH